MLPPVRYSSEVICMTADCVQLSVSGSTSDEPMVMDCRLYPMLPNSCFSLKCGRIYITRSPLKGLRIGSSYYLERQASAQVYSQHIPQEEPQPQLQGVPIFQILRTTDWSSKSTFTKYYYIDLRMIPHSLADRVQAEQGTDSTH